MSKFILVISICSFLDNSCMEPMEDPNIYNSWADCVDSALLKSSEVLKKWPREEIDRHRLATKFMCYPIKET
jgi:hypothetical protein